MANEETEGGDEEGGDGDEGEEEELLGPQKAVHRTSTFHYAAPNLKETEIWNLKDARFILSQNLPS